MTDRSGPCKRCKRARSNDIPSYVRRQRFQRMIKRWRGRCKQMDWTRWHWSKRRDGAPWTSVRPAVCDGRHVWYDPARFRSVISGTAKPRTDPRHATSHFERTLDGPGSSTTEPTISRIQHRRRQPRPSQDRLVDPSRSLCHLYGTATMQECSPLGIGIRSSYVFCFLPFLDAPLTHIF